MQGFKQICTKFTQKWVKNSVRAVQLLAARIKPICKSVCESFKNEAFSR